MGEREEHGVQGLAAQLARNPAQLRVSDRFSVKRIPEDRVPVLGEMHANLMGAPGLEMATN